MVCWQMVRFLIQLRPSMYFDVSWISLQIQSMVHVAWSKMLKVHELYYLTWESVVWRGMFCQLVFGWWFCTPICKSTWRYSHDVNLFFFEGEKWYVSELCFLHDVFFNFMVLFVTRRHKILRRSTLEREPHDYNLIMRIKWECILILKTNRILSYLGLKPSFLNLKYNGVISMPESTTLT